MRTLIFLLVFFFSFSAPSAVQFFPKIEPKFQYEVIEFINDSQGKVTVKIVNPLSMKEASLAWSDPKSDERTIGLCWWLPLGPNRVEIDKLFWEYGSSVSKKALIYHELGHCVCNRDHVPPNSAKWLTDFLDSLQIRHVRAVELPDGCPKSLMNPVMPDDACLQRHWGLYKDELFKTCVPNSMSFLNL